jgi:UDP-N-acetylglucosamine 4,6-dehydratase
VNSRFNEWKAPQLSHGTPCQYGWTVFFPDKLILGTGSDVGSGTVLGAHKGIEIGKEAQIGANCSIYSKDTEGGKEGKVMIGDGACIGAGSVVLPGATIEAGAIVGAGSVVPAGTVVTKGKPWVGIPIKKKRNIYAITGGTGTLGRALTRELLKDESIDHIRIISRDEAKHADMMDEFGKDRIRYILGDVRNRDKMMRAFHGVTTVIHAAAMKRVDAARYNIDECIYTNVDGTIVVLDAALHNEVKRFLYISSDKAAEPSGTYGNSKLTAERYVLGATWCERPHRWAVRLGNILGSTGSIVPTIRKRIEENAPIRITDPDATRFVMTQQEAAQFCLSVFDKQPNLHVPQCRAARVGDIVDAIVGGRECYRHIVGLGKEEKMHEAMLSKREMLSFLMVEEEEQDLYRSDTAPRLSVEEIGGMIDA